MRPVKLHTSRLLASSRSRQHHRMRAMLPEQLQAREVMAADIFDTQETVAVGSLSPVPQIAQPVGVPPVDAPQVVLASGQASDIQVHAFDVLVNNRDGNPNASSSLASENEWITETTRLRAEGEGTDRLSYANRSLSL